MQNKDWLIADHVKFNIQVTQGMNYLLVPANKTRMGFIDGSPGDTYLEDTVIPLMTPYTSLFDKWENVENRTPVIVHSFTRQEKALKTAYRGLYMQFIKYNQLVTDEDLDRMKFPPRWDGTRSPSPVADRPPAVKASISLPRVIRLYFGTPHGKKQNEVKHGKPRGQRGSEIRWALSPANVKNIEDLVNSSFVTRSPLTLFFEEDDRGKAFYFAACWENTRGKKSIFGDIQRVFIP
jgi:hypothetical protein